MAGHVSIETGRGVKGNAAPETRSNARSAIVASPNDGTGAGVAARPARRRMRRTMTREQGRALETIGHAVDYLNDSHLYEGSDSEFVHLAGSPSQALEILIASHREILNSMPLVEPWNLRIWNALFRRKARLQSGPVVT